MPYATVQTLRKRQLVRVKKKQMGIKPGSGYELKGGVKKRMDPQKQMMLKRRGRQMARSAKQQRAMSMGRQRSKSMTGSGAKTKTKAATPVRRIGGKQSMRLAAGVDFNMLSDLPALEENERRHPFDQIMGALEEWVKGNTTEAIRRLVLDPKYALRPIATLSDEIVREMSRAEIDTFIDVEIVEGESLAVYLDKGEGETPDVTTMLEKYGDVGQIARPEDALSDTQTSTFHIFMLKPSEAALKKFEVAEDLGEGDLPTKPDTIDSILKDTGHVGVNRPPMVTVSGAGYDPVVNPPKDDISHLRPREDFEDSPFWTRLRARRAARIARASDLPIGVDPDLGQPD